MQSGTLNPVILALVITISASCPATLMQSGKCTGGNQPNLPNHRKDKTMNFQSMSSEVHKAIEGFTLSHHSTLQLYIRNGIVCTRELKPRAHGALGVLNITVWYQTHGFTHVEWNELITELLNLYNKEKACQNQQKLLAPPNKNSS